MSVKCALVLTSRWSSKHYHMLRIQQRERNTVFVCVLMQPCTHASRASLYGRVCSVWNYLYVGEWERARVEWELTVVLLFIVDASDQLQDILGCTWQKPTSSACLQKVNKKHSQRIKVLLTQSLTHSKCYFIMHNSSVGELCKKMHGQSENGFSRNCHHNPTFPG